VFGHDWEQTTATITMARVRGIGGKTGMKTIFEFEADVAPPGGGEPFSAKLHDPKLERFRPPGEGMTVRVLADAKHQEAKFDPSDPARTSPKNLLAPLDHVPSDGELLAAWQTMEDHSELLDEIKARGDMSQFEAWTATSDDLSMALMYLTQARPDWKSPYQLSRQSAPSSDPWRRP
jgi:hypothetical protein